MDKALIFSNTRLGKQVFKLAVINAFKYLINSFFNTVTCIILCISKNNCLSTAKYQYDKSKYYKRDFYVTKLSISCINEVTIGIAISEIIIFPATISLSAKDFNPKSSTIPAANSIM